MLAVKDVTLHFGSVRALNGLSFDVAPRCITALIGPNGAGKTTFFNVLSGLLKPTSGQILLGDRDLVGKTPERIAQLGIARSFQIPRGFPRLTVFEHLMFHGSGNPGERLRNAFFPWQWRDREQELAERAVEIARQLKLDAVLGNLAEDLSGGQKKLLEIGRALMSEPTLLLLDEPVAGVNPSLSRTIGDELMRLAEGGLTILVIEHDIGLVERISDRVVVAAQGATLMEGTFEEIRENREVQDAYFG